MPLIQMISRYLWFDGPGEDAAKFDVGILGNSRIRAVAHYGKAGFEVSWQIVPARMGGDAPHRERTMTTRLRLKNLHLAALERAANG